MVKRVVLSSIIITAVIMCSCGIKKENTSSNISVPQPTVQVTDDDFTEQNSQQYDIYEITDGESDFSKAINTNEIDAEFNKKLEDATSTAEINEVQIEYKNAWEREMHLAEEEYCEMLLEQDATDFRRIQKSWEESVIADIQKDREILQNNDISLGSASSYLFTAEIRNQFRNRTIKIKYMIYLLKNKGI